MILWFGKKKKKQELLEAGAAMAEPERLAEAAQDAPSQADPLPEADAGSDTLRPGDRGPAEHAVESARDPSAPREAPAPVPAQTRLEAAPVPAQTRLEAAPVPPPAALEPDMPRATETPAELSDPVAGAQPPGFFSKLSQGLSKSSSRMGERLTGLFSRRKLDDDALEDLEDLLLTADMGGKVARRITESLARSRYEKDVTQDELKQALADEIEAIMAPREQIVDFSTGPRPRIVLFVGVNGSGKTTTIGKVASKLKLQGARAILVAGDTFRAAAIEQLKVWGDRAGIPVMSKSTGADAAGLVYEAVEHARREDLDLVLVDTAGRLQNKTELMSELAKIVRVTRKLDPDAPHDVILVLDATVGQNAMSQVEAFRHTADVSGIVMTKLDGTAKGGVLVAIADAHALPIHFVGVGETADDLQPFSARAYARALVGLSDGIELKK